jgi:DNA-binding NarL/FixJ family response regulator
MRIILADDAALIREALALLLVREGFDVVGQLSSAEHLLHEVNARNADAVVVDIRMPPTYTDEGLVAAREIRNASPDTIVLVLSQYEQIGYAASLIETGEQRTGYLLKERVSNAAEFSRTLRHLETGGTIVDAKLVQLLLAQRRLEEPLADLTPREREVLALIAEGLTDLGIARRLYIEPTTVDTHNRSIFRKLNLPATTTQNRRVHAVLTWLRATPNP